MIAATPTDRPARRVPDSAQDPINAAILVIAEDQLEGFHRRPFAEIAERTGLPEATVIARLRAMLTAGTLRRVRQTLVTTNLTDGALIAWSVTPERLDEAFDRFAAVDPFTGHIVIRSTAPGTPGEAYRLWTTLKIPPGYSLERHVAHLREAVGAHSEHIMRARAVFKLGVGHTRRQEIPAG